MTDLEPELTRLGRRLAREQDLLRERSTRRAEVRERIAALQPQPARRRYALHVGIAAAALAALVPLALWLRAPEPEPLVLRVGSSLEPVRAGAWLEAPEGAAPLPLTFSDGTRIELAPHTRMRVVEVDGHGAHLLLESGLAHVSVVPRPKASWRLSVGPFAVRVIGTRFDVKWDPERDDFQLDLSHGRVALSGCVFGTEYFMHVGQVVDASCKRGQLHIRSSAAATRPARAPSAIEPRTVRATDTAPAEAPEAPVQPIEKPAPIKVVSARAERAGPSGAREWRRLAQQGDYADAFAVARAGNFEAECERAGAEDLALLAESARHVGEADEEERALLSIRKRFAGSARAALAAFALGRLEFDQRHAHAKAAQWFGIYLKEQPRGPLAREARGRLLEASLAAGDRARATTLAQAYLQSHPTGPHAALARSVLEPTPEPR